MRYIIVPLFLVWEKVVPCWIQFDFRNTISLNGDIEEVVAYVDLTKGKEE